MPAKKEVTTKKVTKTAPKTEKAAVVKVVAAAVAKPGSLSIPVLSLVGASVGTLNLPKEIFGEKVNKALLAQALRVYTTNQNAHYGSNKTRGEVIGSTRKIYRQKGTGNARHGAKSAPIFVGGGVTFASKYRKTTLDLPKKMKKAALISALSQKMQDGAIVGLDGLDKASGKTKEMFKLFKGLEKKTALIVNDQKADMATRAMGNIQGLNFLTVDHLNAYEIIRHQSLVLTKSAVERLQNIKSENTKTEKSEKNEEVSKASLRVKVEKPKTRKAKA